MLVDISEKDNDNINVAFQSPSGKFEIASVNFEIQDNIVEYRYFFADASFELIPA